ncbi:hypothetical protein ACIHDR_46805 [Nocardia sp. NPDC052278]|uniref:hypothetical protein n=1 Tax=unclassified Nocardia TaxID=2637762 RepID=UPI003680FA43
MTNPLADIPSAAAAPTSTARYSIEVYTWIPLVTLIIVALAVACGFAIFGFVRELRSDYFVKETGLMAFFAIMLAAAVVLATMKMIVVWGPFDGEHHQWRPVRGQITQIDALGGHHDSATESKTSESMVFVVTFTGSDQAYPCRDARCAALRVGDDLELTCKTTRHTSGADERDCDFIRAVTANRK